MPASKRSVDCSMLAADWNRQSDAFAHMRCITRQLPCTQQDQDWTVTLSHLKKDQLLICYSSHWLGCHKCQRKGRGCQRSGHLQSSSHCLLLGMATIDRVARLTPASLDLRLDEAQVFDRHITTLIDEQSECKLSKEVTSYSLAGGAGSKGVAVPDASAVCRPVSVVVAKMTQPHASLLCHCGAHKIHNREPQEQAQIHMFSWCGMWCDASAHRHNV